MQGRFGFVNLYFAGGKAFRTGTLLKPATKEGFAGAVFPPYRLEATASASDRGQFFVQRRRKTVNAYRQRVQSAAWNGPRRKAPTMSSRLAALIIGHLHLP